MLKWIAVLGVCALLAGCHDKSDAQKGAEFERTVTALSTKYPHETDPCGGDPECFSDWVHEGTYGRDDDYPDPDGEDFPYEPR
jgi:hypothetical protein